MISPHSVTYMSLEYCTTYTTDILSYCGEQGHWLLRWLSVVLSCCDAFLWLVWMINFTAEHVTTKSMSDILSLGINCTFRQYQYLINVKITQNLWKSPYYRLAVFVKFFLFLQSPQSTKQFISVDSPSCAEQNGTNSFVCNMYGCWDIVNFNVYR